MLTPIYILTMLPFLLPFVILMEQGQLDKVTLGESSQGDAHMCGQRDHQCENSMPGVFLYCLNFSICANVFEA